MIHVQRLRRATVVGVIALLVASVSAGCGGESRTGPPEIHYGRDACDQCHMIISEARYAAAYRNRNGDPSVFDDIGDMVQHARRAKVLDSMTAWVHDYNTEKWIDADKAWYVRSGIETPMGHGIVAFAGEKAARSFAEEHQGEVLRWQAMIGDDGAGATGPTSSTPDHQMVPTTER